MFDSSIQFNKLLGVSWEFYSNVSTKFAYKIHKEFYFVTLKVLGNNNKVRNINFKCAFEELNDLVNSLNIALKCIENSVNRINKKA